MGGRGAQFFLFFFFKLKFFLFWEEKVGLSGCSILRSVYPSCLSAVAGCLSL